MKTVIVTGASGKLGPVVRSLFEEKGWQVLSQYNTCSCAGRSIPADFRVMSADSFVRRCHDMTGDADLLVNCFSSYEASSIAHSTWETFSGELFLNAWQPFDLCRSFFSLNPGSCAVNVLDTRITGSDPEHFEYHMSKSLLRDLTVELARAYAPLHRVNAVAPGLTETGSGRALPLQRPGTYEDIARAILYLAEAEYTTGQIVFVDGGRHIRG
ncbi:MAG: SDR family oxidoreductase [Abditibacteriota bacterium]|nr:SDR family oxidoreductase [Abditibacteriota bacterium]